MPPSGASAAPATLSPPVPQAVAHRLVPSGVKERAKAGSRRRAGSQPSLNVSSRERVPITIALPSRSTITAAAVSAPGPPKRWLQSGRPSRESLRRKPSPSPADTSSSPPRTSSWSNCPATRIAPSGTMATERAASDSLPRTGTSQASPERPARRVGSPPRSPAIDG